MIISPQPALKPIIWHSFVQTQDREEMRHAMLTQFNASDFTVGVDDRFEGYGDFLMTDRISLGVCAYGGSAIAQFGETDFVRLQI